ALTTRPCSRGDVVVRRSDARVLRVDGDERSVAGGIVAFEARVVVRWRTAPQARCGYRPPVGVPVARVRCRRPGHLVVAEHNVSRHQAQRQARVPAGAGRFVADVGGTDIAVAAIHGRPDTRRRARGVATTRVADGAQATVFTGDAEDGIGTAEPVRTGV